MHLKVEDKKAEKVLLVLLDNKTVQMPVELNTEEGWVKYYVPKNVMSVSKDMGQGVVLESSEELEYDLVKSYGKVEVKFKD